MAPHKSRSRRGGRAAEGLHPGAQVERSVTGNPTAEDKLMVLALDLPFLLLPFRPTSDPSAARTFVRNYFFPQTEREELRGEALKRELRLTEPMVRTITSKRRTWLIIQGPGECHEMVLEQTTRRRGDLGRLRVV